MRRCMRKVVAVEDYDAVYPVALCLTAGEHVHTIRWDSEWPGWIWCEAEDGRAGWVPERILERDRSGGASLTENFDGTEISICLGEHLVVEREESGWLWCRGSEGKVGWVPGNRVRALPPAP